MRRETEVRAELQRERRRLARTAAIVVAIELGVGVLGLAALVLFVAGTFLGLQSLIILANNGFLVFEVLIPVAYFGGRWWVEVKGAGRLVKRIEGADETIKRLHRLQAEHPELVELYEVQAFLDEEKALLDGRRSFWVNIAVNLFFLLLGFALTYTATKLGWLR